MEATDKKITATFTKDNQHLWTEDVFEVFVWPDERDSIYFEYEISPLNKELPIIVPNLDDKFRGWLPWYEGGAGKTRKATSAIGGELKSGAVVKGWRVDQLAHYPRRITHKPGVIGKLGTGACGHVEVSFVKQGRDAETNPASAACQFALCHAVQLGVKGCKKSLGCRPLASLSCFDQRAQSGFQRSSPSPHGRIDAKAFSLSHFEPIVKVLYRSPG